MKAGLSKTHEYPPVGVHLLYYGHCRWALVLVACFLWVLTTRNVDLLPITASLAYVLAHHPARWYMHRRMTLQRTASH